MPTASASLLHAALRQFAAVGFEGASLQRIADDAKVSKSSVLYHFGSKEALLDAALRPAVHDLRRLVDATAQLPGREARERFLGHFVDFLYAHRLEIAVLVNHGSALAGHAVIDEADALVHDLSDRLSPAGTDDREAIRFGVALAGATFVLIAADRWATTPVPPEGIRAALTEVVGELVLRPDTAALPA